MTGDLGEADMRLEFCVACGSKDGLQHGYLVTKTRGGSDAEPNRITLCTSCHDKLHQHRYGVREHSQRIKTALAARRRAVPASADRRSCCRTSARRHCGGSSVESPRPLWRGAMTSANLRLVAWCSPHAFPLNALGEYDWSVEDFSRRTREPDEHFECPIESLKDVITGQATILAPFPR